MDKIIVKNISDLYFVKCDDIIYECKAKGIFRKDKITPTVGDKVEIDIDKKIITKILNRKNILIRPPISNIDQALIVVSVKEPDFSTNLLDKMLNIIEFNNIKPIICLTKLDLLNDNNEIEKYIKYYRSIGYTIIKNTEKEKLKKFFKNKITVLTGQSGVGKSTLLNMLDDSLNINTNSISIALGRGKHTTRHVELLEMFGGLVADTPGFSALNFIGMTKSDIRDNMIEFNKYKDKCRYKDCMHVKEDECKIKEYVNEGKILKSRYDNYLKFIEQSR
jgi:ribosome biogenesis GTPase